MKNDPFKGTVICSLCFLRQTGQVLLARKMRKLVIGLWNGYGGRQEPSETIRTTTCRETYEETDKGIIVFPGALDRRAVVYFHNQKEDGSEFTVKVHVFEAWRWEGHARTTDEMATPTWWPDERLPFNEMPIADRYWLPIVLAGQKLVGHVHYGPGQKALQGQLDIRIVNDLDELEPED